MSTSPLHIPESVTTHEGGGWKDANGLFQSDDESMISVSRSLQGHKRSRPTVSYGTRQRGDDSSDGGEIFKRVRRGGGYSSDMSDVSRAMSSRSVTFNGAVPRTSTFDSGDDDDDDDDDNREIDRLFDSDIGGGGGDDTNGFIGTGSTGGGSYGEYEDDFDHGSLRKRRERIIVQDRGKDDKPTAGTRQLQRLVQPPQTEYDREFQVDNDEESLFWMPTALKHYQESEQLLGPESSQADCWGCSHGNRSMTMVENKYLREIGQTFVENHGSVTPYALAVMIYDQFEETIRQPCNARLRVGELPISEWTRRSIYDHFHKHTLEPTVKFKKYIEYADSLVDHLFHNGLFRRPADLPAGQSVSPSDIRVNEKYMKMFKETLQTVKALYSSQPDRCFLHTPEFHVANDTNRRFIRPKLNVHQSNMREKEVYAERTVSTI